MVKVGDEIKSATVFRLGSGGPESFDIVDLLKGKKAVVFGVPGAFTPTCSKTHCPSFKLNAKKLKEQGADVIICTAVNDPFIMAAWGEEQKAADVIEFVGDSNYELAAQLDLLKDLRKVGLGIRSRRYALIINDLKVEYVGVDDSGVDLSGADAVLAKL